MNLASFLVSLAALAAVVLIGVKTLGQGERSAKAAETSAAASAQAAAASERAARVAESDARIRRLEGLMDVVLRMRELFNSQLAEHDGMWVHPFGSPETLARTALIRTLEGRLAIFGDRFTSTSNLVVLTTTYLWSTNYLEGAIEELKEALVAGASESAPPQLLSPAIGFAETTEITASVVENSDGAHPTAGW